MTDVDSLRRDIVGMIEELRQTVRELGDQGLPETSVVSNARDRLRYIASLTEQSAGQTLNAAEALGDRLRAQQAEAARLAKLARPPQVRAFLAQLQAEHQLSGAEVSEIIQAQAFQDLVGQVVGKLMVMVQKMEDSLAHLLVDEEPAPGQLAGPAISQAERISQSEVDDLFD